MKKIWKNVEDFENFENFEEFVSIMHFEASIPQERIAPPLWNEEELLNSLDYR